MKKFIVIMGEKLFTSLYKNKRPILIGYMVLMLALIGYLLLQSFITNKIEHALKFNLGKEIEVDYNDLTVNLLLKSVSINKVKLKFIDSTSKDDVISIGKIEINNVSYSALFSTGDFDIGEVILENTNSLIYKKRDSTKNKFNWKNYAFEKSIKIELLEIRNANLLAQAVLNDSVLYQVETIELNIKNLRLDRNTLTSQIPFNCDSYKLSTGNVFVALNPFDNINIEGLTIDNNAFIKGFSLKTKYSKEQLQHKIHVERDFIDLQIPEIDLGNFNFKGLENKFQLKASFVLLKKLDLEIYRNKLMPDEMSIKQLFGKKIKQISIPIEFPVVKIKNGLIRYSELVSEQTKPGEIIFTNLNSEILNISNKSLEPIVFKNEAKLMGVSPIAVDWSFYTENGAELFKASGIIKNFETSAINSFLESNLRAQVKGSINELYFTISGDKYVSSGDMQMNYQDFEFVVLKKNRLGVNKLLTALGKMFTNDGSKTDEKGYRYGKIEAKRDPTKSFFNYLWINVEDGILSTFTGNGKKEGKK